MARASRLPARAHRLDSISESGQRRVNEGAAVYTDSLVRWPTFSDSAVSCTLSRLTTAAGTDAPRASSRSAADFDAFCAFELAGLT